MFTQSVYTLSQHICFKYPAIQHIQYQSTTRWHHMEKIKAWCQGTVKDSIDKWTFNRARLPTKCRRGYTETSKRHKVNTKRLRHLRKLKKSWIFFANGIFHKIVLWKSQVKCVVWSYGFKSMPHPFFVLKLAYSCNYKLPFIK